MSVDVEDDPNQKEKEKNMTMQERNTRNEINQMKQNMKSSNQEEDKQQNSQSNKEQQGNQEKEEIEEIEGIEENKEKEEKTPEESMFENSDSEEEDVFNVKTSTWGPPTILRGLHTLLGLAPATDYTFAMRAHNAAGWSPLGQEVNVRKEKKTK